MGDLWVVTSFFNPSRFFTKRKNYDLFSAALARVGVPCLTIECAFRDESFELPASGHTLHVRARDVLWQKERLLNVAIAALPDRCTKVAWLDCDILFDTDGWVDEVTSLLDSHVVVQPFAHALRLPRGVTEDDGSVPRVWSFGGIYREDPTVSASESFSRHGHTGFAWAARRELLDRVGLYDACIAGSADHLMAHAFAGAFENSCVDRILGTTGPHRDHFREWAQRAHAIVRGSMTAGSATVRHLWHGDATHRRYLERNDQLTQAAFDPGRHIALSPSGCWEWRNTDAALQQWLVEYFLLRNEDGDRPFGSAGVDN